MKAQLIEKIVGCRFNSFAAIKVELQAMLEEDVSIEEHGADKEANDHQLDGEWGNQNAFSIWYLRDLQGLYYITEVQS